MFNSLNTSSQPLDEYGDVVAEPDRVVRKGGELVVERGEELLEPIQQLWVHQVARTERLRINEATA